MGKSGVESNIKQVLENLKEAFDFEDFTKPMEEAVSLVKRTAKNSAEGYVPVITGTLQRNIQGRVEEGGMLGQIGHFSPMVEYAPAVHEGSVRGHRPQKYLSRALMDKEDEINNIFAKHISGK